MKKYILMALVGLVTVMPASAQSYRNSRYYNRNTGRLDYSQRNHSRYGNYASNPFYVGFRVGPSFSSVSSDNDFKYSLDYLEVPLVLKYIHNFDRSFSIQPFFGGYVAAGVGGKIKDYYYHESYSAFGDDMDQFKRFDGGLRMGVGIQYDLFYADLTYDLGLSNIGHDDFDDTKNSALMLNVGINL